MLKRVTRAVQYVNITRPVCHALLGKEHTHAHRMMVGTLVMSIGVLIAKSAGHVELAAVAFIGDAIDYGIHGLGLTPFLEFIISNFAEVE